MESHLNNVLSVWKAPQIPKKAPLPFFDVNVPAGFPSPAEDYIQSSLDLNEYLISNPEATFYATLGGDSLIDIGFYHGDVVICDRSLTAKHGNIVMATVGNSITVKIMYAKDQKVILCPANDNYKPIPVNNLDELIIWGPVCGNVRKINPNQTFDVSVN